MYYSIQTKKKNVNQLKDYPVAAQVVFADIQVVPVGQAHAPALQ